MDVKPDFVHLNREVEGHDPGFPGGQEEVSEYDRGGEKCEDETVPVPSDSL